MESAARTKTTRRQSDASLPVARACRLGATSYVVPGSLVENVSLLADQVDDIELILFDLESGASNLPSPAMVADLAALAEIHGLSYTVHLPADLHWSTPTRPRPLDLAARVIELTTPLRPVAYVAHLDHTGLAAPSWPEQALRAIDWVVAHLDTPARLALENLESYPPEPLEAILAARPVGRVLDIGHLWKSQRDPAPLLTTWLPQASVVHLHGVADSDHQSLAVMSPARLGPVLHRLLTWSGIVTLEVFSLAELQTSLQTLASVWQEPAARATASDHAG